MSVRAVLEPLRGAIVFVLAAAGACAALEAYWVNAGSTEPLQAVRAWTVAFALLVPGALLIAWISALSRPVLGPRKGATWLTRSSGSRSGQLRWALVGFACAVAITLVVHASRRVLALGLPPLPTAAALSLGAGALFWVVLGAAATCFSGAGAAQRRPSAFGAALALAAFAAPIAWGIASGTTNGDGGFWAVFGVLRRQELDLRGATIALALAVAAYVGSFVRVSGALAAGLSAAALAAFAATGLRLLDDTALSLAVERAGAATRASLRSLRSWTDSDGDGVSKYFGANDCDDQRDDVYPGAWDVAGNGLDEDCTGADTTVSLALEPPPEREAVAARDAPTDERRLPSDLNVVFITVDTLRHDLGYMGYPRPISPNLDRLAARSVVYERAYAMASYTGKSIGPLLIGKYPSETHRGWWHFNRFDARETFVQERLQAAGIRTLGVQGHWYFTPQYGLGRGFDVLDLSAAPKKRQGEGDQTVNSDDLSDAAIAQLSNADNTRGQFFMWIHYLDPHAEYMRHAGLDFGSKGRDLYDSEVAFTDRHIGRVIDFIEASPFAERTAIVVTSDHGEAFGENGMYRHGYELWEVLVRVPLIVYVPGLAPSRHAVRRSAIDLAPTFLDLMGVPQPDEPRLSGVSLVADLLAPADQPLAERPIFIDMSAGPYNEERKALIEGDYKLIMGAGRVVGLYDLARDPQERVNLVRDRELLKKMLDNMQAFKSGLRWVRVKPR